MANVESTPLTIIVGSRGSVSAVAAYPRGFRRGQHDAVILAHGAGNDMSSPFMCAFHEGLAARGLLSVKFNFPYTEQHRRAPDPAPVLEACYRRVVEAIRQHPRFAPRRLFIGGKSMGGRMASHLAAAGELVDGLVLLGYPLHPSGKPEQLRAAHLERVKVPMLFLAGTRDALSRLDLLRATVDHLRSASAAKIALHIVEGGDHSFNLLKSMKRPDAEVREELVDVVARWIAGCA
ncbi:MAG: dienelactone hydrolase family protein [Deltaproteobacteria bacterium]|nr:dienelactone hydrolase family protein [Deltaproteobacteria bacterium]